MSSLGRIQNSRGVISRGSLHTSGYYSVRVPHDGVRQNVRVHRLVAFGFLGPPPSTSHVVNHIDNDSQNNAAFNLEYVTRAGNIRHYLSIISDKQVLPATRCSKKLLARRVGATVWQSYPSIACASEALSISRDSVRKCCYGKLISCKGYEFQFVEEIDLPEEQWVPAVCPRKGIALSSYRASSHGRIEYPSGRRTFGWTDSSGYCVVRLETTKSFVHRIMVCSFQNMQSFNACWQVNHKDGKKDNNHISNLEVVTHAENIRHAWTLRSNRQVPAARRPVEGRKCGQLEWQSFTGACEASMQLAVDRSSITACCQGRRSNAAGFEWRYAAPKEAGQLAGEEWCKIHLPSFMAAWGKVSTAEKGSFKAPTLSLKNCNLSGTFHWKM